MSTCSDGADVDTRIIHLNCLYYQDSVPRVRGSSCRQLPGFFRPFIFQGILKVSICFLTARKIIYYPHLNLDLGRRAAVKLDRLAGSDGLDLGTLDVDTDGSRLTELTHPASAANTDDLSGGRVLVTLVLVVVTGTGRTGVVVVGVVPVVALGTALTGGPGVLRGTVALFSS